jgi:Gram-negative bacterial TonB protein C-terminal
LRDRIFAMVFGFACLQAHAAGQSVLPGDNLLRPPAPPSGSVMPGPSVSGENLPLPERGFLADGAYKNDYFGFSYPLPPGWEQSFDGPPPSDTGHYVLAEFSRADKLTGSNKGTILITATDQFFAPQEADSPKHLIDAVKAKLGPVYRLEAPPAQLKLANRTFVRLDYQAPVAELHWSILAAQMRCHIVEFVFTSRDAGLLQALIQSVNRMKPQEMSAAGFNEKDENDVPICIHDYATGPNLVHKVDPSFAGPKFTNIPTRIIISQDGKVKQVHVISAFPAQAESIKVALAQWEYKPYFENGQPRAVETGVMFEFPTREEKSQANVPDNSRRY